jgi:hypothetical protein
MQTSDGRTRTCVDPADMLDTEPNGRRPEGLPAALTTSLSPRSVLAMQRSAGNAAVVAALTNAGAAGGRATLQRLRTSGGEWSTDRYEKKENDRGGRKPSPAPPEEGLRGVDIRLKFEPSDELNAEMIGLSQTAQSVVSGTPDIAAHAAKRSIPAGEAVPSGTGAGETDESAHIDQGEGYANPIYATQNPTGTTLDDEKTHLDLGQHGWHYRDSAGELKHREAILFDTPRRPHAQTNSRQVFETAALATRGAQAGTYYGSVRWGWHTDASGNLTEIPLEIVSEGVPSSTFLKAGAMWNDDKVQARNSKRAQDTVDLPIPDVKVTTGEVALTPPAPMVEVLLPEGTRLVIVELHPPLRAGTVRVVDGPHTGLTGEVDQWELVVNERAG